MLRALGSDFLRGTAGGTLMVIAAFLAIPPVLTWLLWLAHGLPAATALRSPDAPMRYYFSFVGMMWLALTALGAMYNARVMRRNMGLPLSTGMLAAWHLGSICTLVFCGNLTAQLCYKFAWHVTWPVLTTCCAMTALTAMVVSAAFWLRDSRWYRLLLAGGLVFACGRWCVVRLTGEVVNGQPTGWLTWTIGDVIVLLSIAGIAGLLFRQAQASFREGGGIRGRLLEHLQDPTRALRDHGSSLPDFAQLDALEALARMDGARVGPLITGLQGGIVLMVGGLLSLIIYGERSNLDGAVTITLMMSSLMGFMAGTVHASTLYHTAAGRPNSSLLTLPVSDELLGRFFSWQAVGLALRVWRAVMLAVVSSVLLCVCLGSWDEVTAKYQQSPQLQAAGWLAVLTPLACLAITWLSCALSMSWIMLPQRFSGGSFVFGCLLGLTLFVTVAFQVPGAAAFMWASLWLLSCVLCGVGTIGLICWTSSQKLLNRATAVRALLVAAIISLLVFVAVPLSMYWKCVLAGLPFLTALPFASLPAALNMCRHRRWTYS